MITCSACGSDKPEEQFSWKIRGVRRQTKCRPCVKKYNARHYASRQPERSDEIHQRRRELADVHHKAVEVWLEGKACHVCDSSEDVATTAPVGQPTLRDLAKAGVGNDTFLAALEDASPTCRSCIGVLASTTTGTSPYPQLTDRSWLVEQYESQGRSQVAIAAEVGCARITVRRWLKHHRIDIRPRDRAAQPERVGV